MSEETVGKIMPEHVGKEIKFDWDLSWNRITAVGEECFLVFVERHNREEQFCRVSPGNDYWVIRDPEPTSMKPSERIEKIIEGQVVYSVVLNAFQEVGKILDEMWEKSK